MKIFKRIRALLLVVVLLLSVLPSFLLTPALSAASANLISNPSFETADSSDASLPENWQKGGWGTNTRTYTYDSVARTGAKSVKVSISSYSSGDAKWYAAPVSVVSGTQYTFSDYYKSSALSYVVAQYADASGNYTYQELGTAPIAADWQLFQTQLTAPASAKEVTIFHLLRSVGDLSTDDYSLTTVETTPAPTPDPTPTPTPDPTPAPSTDNLFVNPSAETNTNGGAGTADGWTSSKWGTNSPTFSVTSDAKTGTRALKTVLSSHSSGDAKWFPTQVTAVASTKYVFSDAYKSTQETYVVAELEDATGNYTYVDIGTAPASTAWNTFAGEFTTLSSTKKVTVYHVLASVGELTVDDYVLTQSTPAAPGSNLVPNPSLETVAANGSGPSSWAYDSWGTNTPVYSYEASGHTGSKSGKVQITSYASGDAKWYFSHVSVTAGTAYSFSDYYISDVTTKVVAEVEGANGAMTYIDIASAPASASWKQFQGTFTTPSGAQRVTILHVLPAVGILTVDDFSLSVSNGTDPNPTPADENLIPNPSHETASGNKPANWQSEKWGTNTATFSYVQGDAHTGARSLKTTVSNYTSGDAKWFFTPLTNLVSGKSYEFSLWYKTNTQAHMVAAYTDSAGVEQYLTLPNPLAGADAANVWQQYSTKVDVPVGATTFTVYALVSSNGWLQTDDYNLVPSTKVGFNAPLISITFDDGWESIYASALPLLQKYGLITTQYLISGTLNTDEYMTTAMVQAFIAAGHEIGSHTVTHADLAKLTPAELSAELENSRNTLQQMFGVSVAESIASPYGSYSAATVAAIKQVYQSHRTTDIGYNSKDNFNPYNILIQHINTDTTPEEVATWIAKAKAEKTWLVLVYHKVMNGGTADDYAVTPSDLDTELNMIKASGIEVKTISQALAVLQSQM